MNAITADTLPLLAIEWPAPIINDPAAALDDATCSAERLRILLADAVWEFGEELISHDSKRLNALFCIFRVVEEKAEEMERLLLAINEAMLAERREAVTSVGKHTDIMRRRHWIAAVEAYRAADAVPVTDDTDEAVGKACAAAFQAMVETPAPDLRAFHEKMTLIQSHNAWSLHGATDALFADVERFARAEIAAAKLEG